MKISPYQIKWQGPFKCGWARVLNTNGTWNFINEKYELIGSKWFEYVLDFSEDFAVVRRLEDGRENFISTSGRLLTFWLESAESFNHGEGRIFDDRSIYTITAKGEIVAGMNC